VTDILRALGAFVLGVLLLAVALYATHKALMGGLPLSPGEETP
jgi:hypothetical protein